MRRTGRNCLVGATLLALLMVASRASAQAELSFETAAAADLRKLSEVAQRQHPDLEAAQARIEAARGRLIQAGLWPNPFIQPRFNQVAHNDNAVGEVGVMVMQDIVPRRKFVLARAAAQEGVRAADWQATTRWFEVLTRLRLAYFDVLAAQQEVKTAEQIVKLSQAGLDAAHKLFNAGAGNRPDILRAQVELDQNRILHTNAVRKADAAWRVLGTALGQTQPVNLSLEGDLERPAPAFEWHALVGEALERSSEIQEAQANVMQAEWLWQRARAERMPNLQISVMPFYSAPERDPRLQVGIGANLPVFNRNQGAIYEAEANLGRSLAEVRQIEVRLTERLAGAFQRYQTAREQVHAYQKSILPNARESLRLLRLGYERGDPKFDYTTVLQAQQTLAQIQMTYVQALGTQWKALAELAGLIQRDEF